MDIVSLLLAGVTAGMLAGLLGIGGGTIIVPVIVIILDAQSVSADVMIKIAVGTSLATIAVSALPSIYVHHRKGAIEWPVVRRLTPWIMAGAIVGVVIVDLLPGKILHIAFIGFLFIAAIRTLAGTVEGKRQLPGLAGMAGIGLVNGVISSMMGIAGGVINVPFFSYCSMPIRRAVATAATVGMPLALISTVSYAITGQNEAGLPESSIGYINLPIFAGVVSASVLFAPLGARLAHIIPERTLGLLFSLFLLVMAGRMIWSLL